MEPEEIFHDITQIHETNKQHEANAYLELGWRLLKVVTRRDEYEYASYVLGWPSTQPPKRPERRSFD
jgi:hypothetical protein